MPRATGVVQFVLLDVLVEKEADRAKNYQIATHHPKANVDWRQIFLTVAVFRCFVPDHGNHGRLGDAGFSRVVLIIVVVDYTPYFEVMFFHFLISFLASSIDQTHHQMGSL